MGNSQQISALSTYGQAKHPIHGDVKAFLIKGEAGKFVMETKMSITEKQRQLYERISEKKTQYLIQYYGHVGDNKFSQGDKGANPKKHENLTNGIKQSNHNKDIKMNSTVKNEREYELFWEYLNYDLFSFTVDFKQKGINEDILWEIINNMLEAAIFLKQFNIYPFFTNRYIYFSSGKEPKYYWAHLLPDNMHRPYDRYLGIGQFMHSYYAPEELLQITRTQRRELDKQKCTTFNLGIVILSCISKSETKKMYNYQAKILSEVNKRQIITHTKNCTKYSEQFWFLMNQMLQYFPKDRCNYDKLKRKLDKHYLRNQFSLSNMDIKFQQQTSKVEYKDDKTQNSKIEKSMLKSSISSKAQEKLSMMVNC